MPSKHISPQRDPIWSKTLAQARLTTDSDDTLKGHSLASQESSFIHVSSRTLSPISPSAMNTVKLVTDTEPTPSASDRAAKPTNGLNGQNSLYDRYRSTGDLERDDSTTSLNAISHSKSNGALSTASSRSSIPRSATTLPTSNSSVRLISAEFGGPRSYSNFPIAEDVSANNAGTSPQQWSSAVGKANLGKSGRVIDRLMGENDMLKRDLQIERLRGEESKGAIKMSESKMEALVAEYEGRLHDASINKTLLKRKERQLAELKSQVDSERQRAVAALERERGWREAMEKMEKDAKLKVDEATNFALLMDGRNKALASHWKDQGELVSSTVTKLGAEIAALLEDRKKDGDNMVQLQALCDQNDNSLRSLQAEKEAIAMAFKEYQKEQETLLANIKSKAKAQETSNEELLEETQRVLGELKWALGVKANVRGAK